MWPDKPGASSPQDAVFQAWRFKVARELGDIMLAYGVVTFWSLRVLLLLLSASHVK